MALSVTDNLKRCLKKVRATGPQSQSMRQIKRKLPFRREPVAEHPKEEKAKERTAA